MHLIQTRNVHQALPAGMKMLLEHGFDRDSRNGPVRVMDGPVTTRYERPTERVLFYPERDANPFFHFYESLWMLGGRRDVKSVAKYAATMKSFSDDGKTFHGAYGYRWRSHFEFDQLNTIADALTANPDDRRCVLQMWDANVDLGRQGKDFPCNTQAYFSVSKDGVLDMTVCNRSNDMIWGAYGANAVHFSALQEYMAAAVGVPVGDYWQMSNNFHAYRDVLTKHIAVLENAEGNPYVLDQVEPFRMVNTSIREWSNDLEMFLDDVDLVRFNDVFFRRVAVPIRAAWAHYQNKELGEARFTGAVQILEQCMASDWRVACSEWIVRRHKKWSKAQDDGPTDNAG